MKPLVSAVAAAIFLMGRRRDPAAKTGEEEEEEEGGDGKGAATSALISTSTSTDLNDHTLMTRIDSYHPTQSDPSADSPDLENDLDFDYSDPSDTSPPPSPRGFMHAMRTSKIGRFSSPAEWDWSDTPDDASIWAATAAILGGRRPFSTDDEASETDDDPETARARFDFRDAIETLSAAMRGLGVQTPASAKRGLSQNSSDDEADDHVTERQNDFRPLIAVTIGVTLFLLARSPKAARRAELEEGATGGTLIVDDDGLLSTTQVSRDDSLLSDLRSRPRDIVIVTTAALPWMTGTAVNPLLRAVYLAKAGHTVSLVVPWLESPEDQRIVYPAGTLFSSREEQVVVITNWAREQVPGVNIRIRFYEGVYSKEFGSILPLGDITAMFADDEPKDVCVLEEPEHLTWFHTGRRWTSLFKFCVGIVHTNYIEYAKKHGVFGPQRALFLSFLNKWVCRSYCHRVIKLSDAVQTLPHSVVCNVHGVRNRFIDIGSKRGGEPFEKGAYFLGKVLWTKGYAQLVDLIQDHYDRTEERLPIDFFGAGPDLDAVKKRVKDSFAFSRVQIHGLVVDHASEYLQKYKVYVNPSKSDVVCTATAEALAMGKFAICLKHPSNEFFSTFDNCLIYETPQQFASLLAFALQNEPKPLSPTDVYRFSWEAATERFYDAAHVPAPSLSGRMDSALALTHKTICATFVTPPANNAVRARYKRARRNPLLDAVKAQREQRDGSSRVSVP